MSDDNTTRESVMSTDENRPEPHQSKGQDTTRTNWARLLERFRGLDGVHGTHGEPHQDEGSLKWAIKKTAQTIRETATADLARAHIEGRRPLGLVPVCSDGLARWGSIDVDDYSGDMIALA